MGLNSAHERVSQQVRVNVKAIWGVLARVLTHTSQRLRTNGKPCGTGLLGSRCHDKASSLACQTRHEQEEGSMSLYQDQDDQDVSLMAYDQYMRLVNWTPRLSDEEILQLLQRIAVGKTEQTKACPDSRVLAQAKEARDHLVVGLQRLVMSLAQRCHRGSQHMELLDLIQEGNI